MKKVMIFGTFDVVHCGHIHMFREAKEYGDILIAVVGRDVNIERIKGIGPMHNETERKIFLEQIKLIDEVIMGDKTDVYKVIKENKPDVIALGYDQKVYVDKLADAITEFGLNTKIVKLSAYRPNRFKSTKIKKYIEKVI